MKINKIKVNNYGNLKEKEIDLKEGINIIYGQNESGKSTLINFITNSFYGISKNKKGKEISDYEKYKPWTGEDFSGKIEYELDNNTKFEIYRDFNKKNPKIFNENIEDISKEFNIDKTKGNEFFYEQTKIDEDLFLSTLAINQKQVKLEDKKQSMLIQKISNLAQTGNDNVSFKRVIDRINRRQLDEVGTERSREKPINIINRKIEQLEAEKERLNQYKNFQYEFEEKQNELKEEIADLENENKYLKEIKQFNENEKIEEEKIRIQQKMKEDNLEKINELDNKIDEIKNNNYQNLNKTNSKNNLKVKLIIVLAILIIANVLQFILIKNKTISYSLFTTIPVYLIIYFLLIKKEKNRQTIENNRNEKIKTEIKDIQKQISIIEENNIQLEKEISELKNNQDTRKRDAIEKIKEKYTKTNEVDYSNVNLRIEEVQRKINDKKLKLHSLELDKNNIEPELENLSNIEEELIINKENLSNLNKLNSSFNMAKETIEKAYEKMKNSVTPLFTQNLSTSISKITNGKYNNVMFNEEEGLIIELKDGSYASSNKMSIGTIDQLYLSLRLSMLDELSEEKVPILLDEAFAFYDDRRLKNVLLYLNELKNRQIIIFTCTEREKKIMENNKLQYSFIEL